MGHKRLASDRHRKIPLQGLKMKSRLGVVHLLLSPMSARERKPRENGCTKFWGRGGHKRRDYHLSQRV